MPADALKLVFTDLDGSLLDHHTYSYKSAQQQLRRLERSGIPVVPATSKTRSEVELLRQELANDHPFIVENGAAVFIPVGYFSRQPPDTQEIEDYWVRAFCAPREHWLALLSSLRASFDDEFDHFFNAGVDGVMRMTGLSRELATLANQREFTEPVKWLGTRERRERFMMQLKEAGATVLAGGRFLSVAGDCDKGRALVWLRQLYCEDRGESVCHDLAIGDSGNDCAMLEVAQSALLVRSPVHDFPALRRDTGVMHSTGYGPTGWAEGVARWLQQFDT
tara:strand:- start:82743 stop:83576 length:834 start_codon:yes stop_codon:yes gene_type:complete